MKPLPNHAEKILRARERGQKPADLLIVSDGEHGLHLHLPNPVVDIDPAVAPDGYEWGFAAGLDIEIATAGDGNRRVALAHALLRVAPRYLRMWDLTSGLLIRIHWCGITRIEPEWQGAFACNS